MTQIDTQDFSPGTFGCHEALDRCSLFADLVDEFSEHQAIMQNPEWKRLADIAATALVDLYQAIGLKHGAEALRLAQDGDNPAETENPTSTA
jgi:hypothetical protein